MIPLHNDTVVEELFKSYLMSSVTPPLGYTQNQIEHTEQLKPDIKHVYSGIHVCNHIFEF